MALGQNRRRLFVKGLGTFDFRETWPTDDEVEQALGFLQDVQHMDDYDMEEVMSDQGHMINYLPKTQKVTGIANLLQTTKEEIDVLRNSPGKLYAIRYHGVAGDGYWQYYMYPEVRLTPTVNLKYAVGLRVLPVAFAALHQSEVAYSIPEYVLMERTEEMLVSGLSLWFEPNEGLNVDTAQILDFSGHENHATIYPSGDVATIWDLRQKGRNRNRDSHRNSGQDGRGS